MLDKLTPNQRLMLAVAMSVVFFVAYTAIFPPAEPENLEANKNTEQSIALKQDSSTQVKTSSAASSTVEQTTGHSISEVEKYGTSDANTILTVTNKDFILKIDTLGRISSKELLQAKFNTKEGGHAQLIPSTGMKPLFVRFLDEVLNNESTTVAYTANVEKIALDGTPQTVTLTQKLSSLVVTKELTFYADGHYDAQISLSQDKRYFIYLGQRPQVNETEQMMTVTGAMVYTDDELVTIVEDGDAEGRKSFSGVEFNYGSKYWFSATQGAEDMYNKLAIRGHASEIYGIWKFHKSLQTKLGFISMHEDYTGSGWHFAEPAKKDATQSVSYLSIDAKF